MEILQYTFIQKALLGGVAIALCCGMLGPFLVLRKQSLIGDGLAHLIFGGIAIGLLFDLDPLWSALITAIIGSFSIQKMIEKKFYGDAVIALLLSFGVGVGIVVMSITDKLNTSLYSYLVGSILALTTRDLMVILGVLVANVFCLIKFYSVWFYFTFNEELSRLQSRHLSQANFFFTIATAVTIVISIRAIGILLVSALLVIPTLVALSVSRSFKETLVLSLITGVVSVIAGIFIAYIANISPGGAIVLLLFFIFILVTGFKKLLLK